MRVFLLEVPVPVAASDKLTTTIISITVLVKISTLGLVGLGSKLCVCTYSINITFIYDDINSLLLCRAFLNSDCIPCYNHFLRFIFLLLLHLYLLR